MKLHFLFSLFIHISRGGSEAAASRLRQNICLRFREFLLHSIKYLPCYDIMKIYELRGSTSLQQGVKKTWRAQLHQLLESHWVLFYYNNQYFHRLKRSEGFGEWGYEVATRNSLAFIKGGTMS